MGKSSEKQWYLVFAKYSSLGFQIALSLALGVYGGQKADEHFHSTPFLTLLGVILGSGLAFYQLYKLTKK